MMPVFFILCLIVLLLIHSPLHRRRIQDGLDMEARRESEGKGNRAHYLKMMSQDIPQAGRPTCTYILHEL